MPNPSGKHKPKRNHHGTGSVFKRTDHYRARPWVAVVPYVDESGRRREMWLSAGSRDEADALRKAELARMAKGVVRTEHTVGDHLSSWLSTVEVGPGTLPRYQAHITERLAPFLGSVPLRDLRPNQVRAAMMSWSGAPQTRGGALRLLRAAMKQAVADHLIEHDPTAGIPYPKVPRREPVTLSAEQARHLMATVKGERFAPILVLSLGLGVRRGEALGLRTKDINWESDDVVGGPEDAGAAGRPRRERVLGREGIAESGGGALASGVAMGHRAVGGRASVGAGVLAVQGAVLRPVSVTISKGLRYIPPPLRAPDEGPYRLTGTKTGETREIPLPAFVADALRARLDERAAERKATKVDAGNDFVFCDRFGNSVPLETLRTWYLGALERAGLPAIRWHDLRASCITVLLDNGVDLLTIQRIVGHRDLATTRRYVGKTPTAMAAAAQKLGEAMGG